MAEKFGEQVKIYYTNNKQTTSVTGIDASSYILFNGGSNHIYTHGKDFAADPSHTHKFLELSDVKDTFSIQNTSDTWVPVIVNGKIYHRIIPAAYNQDPSTLSVNSANTANTANTANSLSATCAANDYIGIKGGGSNDNGYLEIYTGDNGNEPIYLRQYSYDSSVAIHSATLLDSNGNTSFPGTISSNGHTVLTNRIDPIISVACTSSGILTFTSNNNNKYEFNFNHTLTIGNSTKSIGLNGSQTWSLSDIGAQPIGSYATGLNRSQVTKITGNTLDLNLFQAGKSVFYEIRGTELTYTNSPMSGYYGVLSLYTPDNIAKMQIAASNNNFFIRGMQDGAAHITTKWNRIWTSESLTKVSQLTNDAGYLTQHQSLTTYAKTDWVNKTFLPLTGGTVNGEVAANSFLINTTTGIRFKNDILGDGGDTAFIKILGTGENQQLTIGVTNDAGDIVNITTPAATGFKHNGNVVWDSANDGGGSGLDADLLDGVHLNGIFTNLANNGNNVQLTIGGVTKTLTVNYASNADTLNGLHSSSFAPYNGAKFGHSPDSNIWHQVLQFTTNWIGQVTFMYSPEECQRDYWGIFNINIRSKDIWFQGFNFSNLPEMKCIGDDSNNWSVWVKGNPNEYNPYGVIQVLNFTNASIVSVGLSKSQAEEPSGKYVKTPIIISAGKVHKVTLWGQPFDGTGNVSGDMTGVGNMSLTNPGSTGTRFITSVVGDTDYWRIGGGATASNAGYAEIATADDGTEPIYVRQYTGVFSNVARTATLLDGEGNTSFPGSLSVGGSISEGGQQLSSKYVHQTYFHWSGKGGQPTWLWGGDNENNYYVYNPSNFNVNYATSAGTATNLNVGGYGSGNAIYAGTGDNATYDTYNLRLASWYGIGIYDACDKKTTVVINTRNGNISTQGRLTAASATVGGQAVVLNNDARLTNARPASDVYAWAKASSKPSYSWNEIGSKPSTFTPSTHTHDFLVVDRADTNSFNLPYHDFQVLYAGGGNGIEGRPADVDAFGLLKFRVAAGWSGQILFANGGDLYIRSAEDSKLNKSLPWKRIIDSGNIGSQSVNHATNADTAIKLKDYNGSNNIYCGYAGDGLNSDNIGWMVGIKANPTGNNIYYKDVSKGELQKWLGFNANDFVKAFSTSNDNIDSDWGQSFKTFDPIPSGTPPEKNPNISLLSIGNNFNRRKQLAFMYSNDNIYYRRHVNGAFTNWKRIAFASEIPTKSSWNYDDRYLKLTGGTVNGEVAANSFLINTTTGIRFKNDILGSGGDTAFIKILGTGEDQQLTIGVTNDAGDIVNITTPAATGFKHNGNVVWDSANDGGGSGLDADLLDGVHLNSIFTNLTNNGNNVQLTIGGVTKALTINYAKNADTIDGAHLSDIKNWSDRTASVYWKAGWYKVASAQTATNTEAFLTLDVNAAKSNGHATLFIRKRADSKPYFICTYNNNLDLADFRLYYNGMSMVLYARVPNDWNGRVFRIISEGREGAYDHIWTLYSNISSTDPNAISAEGENPYINPTYSGRVDWSNSSDNANSAGNADTVDGEHATNFSYTHQTSFDFNTAKSSRIVTFDEPNTNYGWINGFASTHNNYLTSIIFNSHRTSNWYVGYIEAHNGVTNGLLAVKQLAFVDSNVASATNADTTDGIHLDWSRNYTEGNYLAIWDNDGKHIRPIPKENASVGYANNAGNATNANSSDIIKYLGNHNETASGNTDNAANAGMLKSSGLFLTGTYSDNATPTNYGNIINVAGLGGSQLLLGWSGTNSVTDKVYYRSHRDNGGGWGEWKQLAYTTDLTWENISGRPSSLPANGGNADTADRALALKDYNGSKNIYCGYDGAGLNSGNIGYMVGIQAAGGNNIYYKNVSKSELQKWLGIDSYVKALGTSNDNIDSDWGQSFKTFDPIPLGTPPEQNPNISLLSIGENFNRRKQLAFTHSNDNIYYRRHVDGGFTNWKRIAFVDSNVASATKLQTQRTIWGQIFDGTGNVNGTIYINNSNSSNGAIRLNSDISSNARISAIDDQVIFNTGNAIRFGTTDWDWNQWAGLKYTYSTKTIALGIADGTVFNANSAQSGGTLIFPGIKNVLIGTMANSYNQYMLYVNGQTGINGSLRALGGAKIQNGLDIDNNLIFSASEAHIGAGGTYSDPWSGLSVNFKFGGTLCATQVYAKSGLSAQGGNFYTDSNGAYWTSDIRKKHDFSNITKDIADKFFEKNYFKHFKWNDTNHDSWGVAAQEFEEWAPEAINTDEDGFKSANYDVAEAKAIAAMTYKIKEQQITINELKEKLKNFEKMLNKLI